MSELTRLFETRAFDQLRTQFPLFKLNAPDLPLPGAWLCSLASQAGDSPIKTAGKLKRDLRLEEYGEQLDLLCRRILYDETTMLPVQLAKHLPAVAVPTVPGHLWGYDTAGCSGGPRPASVMLIGKIPGRDEAAARRNFIGPTSADLYRVLEDLHVPTQEWHEWYITNLIKWPNPDPAAADLPNAWTQDCLPLLLQEIRLVRPDTILCIGSEAAKAVLGKSTTVSGSIGRVFDYTYCVSDAGQPLQTKTAKVVVCNHPAQVFRNPSMYPEFRHAVSYFLQVVRGAGNFVDCVEDTLSRHIHTLCELRQVVDAVRADPNRWLIAVDAEWHGTHPHEPGAYLMTVQVSTRHQEGINVVLRNSSGKAAFSPTIDAAVLQLRRLLLPDGDYKPQIGGHFFRADLPWLRSAGLDLYDVYDTDSGGWDTSLGLHAVNETGPFGLKPNAVRMTNMRRYDEQLANYIASKAGDDTDGFGGIPDDLRDEYAAADADATRRIAVALFRPGGLLDKDRYGLNCWTPYLTAHGASTAALEMEDNGIQMDAARVDKLSVCYTQARDELQAALRTRIGWPEFSHRSYDAKVAWIFGPEYLRKPYTLPPGVRSLGLTPVKTTGKKPTTWAKVVSKGQQERYKPSVNKETLGILGHRCPEVRMLRDLCFLDFALHSVLRTPERDQMTGLYCESEDGESLLYTDGLISNAVAGRVHTRLSQVKETGRWASYRPNLTNISNRREDDYRRILQKEYPQLITVKYQHPLRSVLCATPGMLLLEVDIKVAEVAVLAWVSGDENMIEDVRRSMLPETDADYLDLHAQTAVDAFKLDCAPTKKALEDAGMAGKRVAAKNVRFGIPYGRGPEAIALQCAEEGTFITTADAAQLIEYYYQRYTSTAAYLEECRNRVESPGWLCTAHGRYRRFGQAHDEGVLADMQREAQNIPIQGTVADTVNKWLRGLRRHLRRRPDLGARLLLQVHDAVLLEAPEDKALEVGHIAEQELAAIDILPYRLDGTLPADHRVFHFSGDAKFFRNWGEPIKL